MYTANNYGIMVFDDPAPLGYGWSLMPALRATRTVLGRPDELYKFIGDPNFQPDMTAAAFMCTSRTLVNSTEYPNKYDSEHDVFTFALPSKTIKRVLDLSDNGVRFVGAEDDEYRIDADSSLESITVTDPLGIKYVFGGKKEYYHEEGGKLVPTAWALNKIVLDNGRTINFNWSLTNRSFAKRNWLGGHSFMDSWDLYQWGNSGVTQDSFENDNYAEAAFSRCNETEWFVYFYDKHGRQVYTSKTVAIEPELADISQNFRIATYTGKSMAEYAGYTIEPMPCIPVDMPFAAAYYDNYGFLALDGTPTIPAITQQRVDLQTGAVDYGSSNVGRYTVFVYDNWGRVIKQYDQTAKGLATTDYVLDRVGNPLSATSTLKQHNGTAQNYSQTFAYDNAGRVTEWTATLNGKTASTKVTYGSFGSVATEKFGNDVERRYGYDCHGWINQITTSIPMVHRVIDPIIPTLFYSNVLKAGSDDFVLSPLSTDYTETVLYADGVNPRYDGTASAHVSTLGGRYDYGFDSHDRLVRADYTHGEDASANEDFTAIYTYNSAGAPTSVKRYGITDISKDAAGKITETFDVMDNLAYTWDGILLTSVNAVANGTDFVGRTGFRKSAAGGTSIFTWDKAGLLYSDTSRDITKILYNWAGLPLQITFTDGGYLRYSYNADGSVSSVTSYANTGGRRPTLISERTYCGDMVFEGDSLVMVNFDGGYFDGNGQPHYRHTDWQGSVTMVTDNNGDLVQHTGYYPYGEPWREPSGQPYLFGGKERLRDNALNEYDFAARHLNSALCIWTAPDPLADDYAPTNPYTYCAANPIKFIDPTGCIVQDNKGKDLASLKSYLQNQIDLIKTSDLFENNNCLRQYAKFMENQIYEIETLEKSDQLYIISKSGGKDGFLSYDRKNDAVVIAMGYDATIKDDLNNGIRAHEVHHAFQYEKGRLSIRTDGLSPTLYDIYNEVESYNVERAIMMGAIFFESPNTEYDGYPLKVNSTHVRKMNNGVYKDLPGKKLHLSNKMRFKIDEINKGSNGKVEYYKGATY